jgi:amino acid transporter
MDRADVISRFAYVVTASEELVAVKDALAFHYDDGVVNLKWSVGQNVDAAIWIALFLVIVTIINMVPVRVCSPLFTS